MPDNTTSSLGNNDEIMEKKLREIFSYINNWLNFAEMKNAGLVIINITLIGILVTVILNENVPDFLVLRIFLIFNLMMFIIGLLISLLSFLPNASSLNIGVNNISETDNLIFYGSLAKCDNPKNYLSTLYKVYFEKYKEEDSHCKLELHYAEEILINAKIANKKYAFFKIALIFTVIGVFSPYFIIIFTKIFKYIFCLIKKKFNLLKATMA